MQANLSKVRWAVLGGRFHLNTFTRTDRDGNWKVQHLTLYLLFCSILFCSLTSSWAQSRAFTEDTRKPCPSSAPSPPMAPCCPWSKIQSPHRGPEDLASVCLQYTPSLFLLTHSTPATQASSLFLELTRYNLVSGPLHMLSFLHGSFFSQIHTMVVLLPPSGFLSERSSLVSICKIILPTPALRNTLFILFLFNFSPRNSVPSDLP